VVHTERAARRQGQDAVRRLILLLAVMGCAQLGAPPGGPEDRNPPHLLRISPDTNALNARPRDVDLRFDEIINERPARGGQDLSALFLISPRRGRVDVRWKRSRIEIRPRRGWAPNTTYTITQLPGVSDLRGNADTVEHKYIFTTGPSRATSNIRGQVFDWVAGRAAPRAYVEAVQLPDSLTYSEYTDSLGRFTFQYLPPGRYHLRSVIDANTNRVIDRRELFDSVTVTLADTLQREMLAFIHDSLGPGVSEVSITDSLTLRVALDKPLQPNVAVTREQFSIRAADSSVVPITAVLVGSAYQRELDDSARAKAVRDSVTSAQIADSIRRANPQAPAPRPPAPTPAPPRRPAADTTPPPRPSRPSPETFVVIRLERPLAPAASYRLRAENLRNLMGIVRSSDRVFTTARARSAPDSVRPDTAGAPPRRPPGDGDRAPRFLRSLFTPSPRGSGGALGGPGSRPATSQHPRRP
jgi:hypothetical protein